MTCSTRAMNGLMPVEGAQRPDTCAWWPRSRTRQRRAAAARPRAADTIASAIAVIAIQAGVADHALERCEAEPGRAREALQTIRAASLQALNNVLRHAGSATATVGLTYREGDLTVQVDDDGHRAATRRPLGVFGGGNGLLGMGQRVAALGGRLEAGPRPGGGFRVVATMPLNGAA